MPVAQESGAAPAFDENEQQVSGSEAPRHLYRSGQEPGKVVRRKGHSGPKVSSGSSLDSPIEPRPYSFTSIGSPTCWELR
jgi:hypothetical protein